MEGNVQVIIAHFEDIYQTRYYRKGTRQSETWAEDSIASEDDDIDPTSLLATNDVK